MIDRNEMITAYLDGTLDGPALEAFEAELAQDDALAEDVARIAANDDLLRTAFDAPMHEPVDAALLERMGLAKPDVASPTAANDNPPFWRRWQLPVGGAIAASLALFAMLQTGQGPETQSEFAAVMEQTPSAASKMLTNGANITPRLTFVAGDGRYCREYLQTGKSGNQTGIACRSEGKWQVEALIKGGSSAPDPGDIAVASGENGSSLDEAYAKLDASDPVSADTERALIDKSWSGR